MTGHVPCDLCSSQERALLFRRDRSGAKVHNQICLGCGLVYVSPREDPEAIQERYLGGSFSREARGALAPSPGKFWQSEVTALDRLRFLLSSPEFGRLPPGNALEAGCGVGSLLRLLRALGWSPSGLEPDPEYARAGEAAYGINILAQTFEQAPLEDVNFGLVAAFHVLEHLASPRRFLERVRSLIIDGGILALEVPSLERPPGGNFEKFFWSAHLYSFTANTLAGLLAACGFEVVRREFAGDFLRVLARKADGVSPPPYPLEDPALVIARVREWERGGEKQRDERTRAAPESLAARILHKARSDPRGLWPAVKRRLGGRFRVRFGRRRFVHFCLSGKGNAGDTLLFPATREAMDFFLGRRRWLPLPLREEVTDGVVDRINAEAQAVVIGGGGLFLKDTNPNLNSGWQWDIPLARLKRIAPPLIVFAVGYNRFPGQEEFAPVFREHLAQAIGQSIFFGLRNRGSIRRLAEYIEPQLASRLVFQPCPTTVLNRLHPGYRKRGWPEKLKLLSLNTAFDRPTLRYRGQEHEILSRIARALKRLQEEGWRIILANHLQTDATVIPWLISQKVAFEEVVLYDKTPKEIMDFYHQIPLALGMRGHSQMIPFGLGNAIVSLISHEKLGYFLEDIGAPEWGVNIHDAGLEEKLIAQVRSFEENREGHLARIEEAQEKLWQITRDNFAAIGRALGIPAGKEKK